MHWNGKHFGMDLANAAVNSNPSITDVQKLNYLRSQLRGEASLVITGFSLISANYNHCDTAQRSLWSTTETDCSPHAGTLGST